MTPDDLLELFDTTARAIAAAVRGIDPIARRARTEKPSQYALDLVADAAALEHLQRAPVRIVSEESGVHERTGADITVVVDPVDGSTNCARGIAYWCTSLCALDADGLLASHVLNHASGACTTATRGGGAFRDGVRLAAAQTTRPQDAVVAFGFLPKQPIAVKQVRILGSIALELCDVAAGGLDAHLDVGSFIAPWDYLGGMLACLEAGAVVRDGQRRDLVTADIAARRQVIAAGTAQLADALEPAVI
jgi:fructose-1,6-bisphosphatase/inositol monophosphatase family enzyme